MKSPNYNYIYKWKIVAILSVLTLSIHSCDDIIDQISDDKDEYFIDLDTAHIAANNLLFPEPIDADTTARTLRVEDYIISKTIDNITPLYDEDDDDSVIFYIVNYEEGGFVLISADRRVEPVLARSNINFFPYESTGINLGLAKWMTEKRDYVQQLRNNNSTPSTRIQLLWENLLESEVPVTFINNPFCGENGYIEEKKLVRTQWGQGCGYNDSLPAMGCDQGWYCGKPLTGCVAVAMSQMVKYHADLGWSGAFYIDNALVQLLYNLMPYGNVPANDPQEIPDLMKAMGTLADASYGCELSGANSNDAYDAFVDNLGFHHAEFRDFSPSSDFNLMINEFDENRPVYLSGCSSKEQKWIFFTAYEGCHAWIGDGYSQRFNCEGEETGTFEIHMNWGWGGYSDGYFLKKEESYEYRRRIMYNMFQDSYDYEW